MQVCRIVVGALVGAVLWHAAGSACAGTDGSERTQAVLQALRSLRNGGHVLVVTHGAVGEHERDDPTARADDCARQQGLNDYGRLAATGLGKLLTRLQVPVGSIVSSHYCRAVETAQRIAEGTRTKRLSRLDALNDAAAVPPAVAQARAMALSNLASTKPAARTNLLLVTHRSNVTQAFTADTPVGDGELWVFRPLPGASHELIERVRLSELSAVMRSLNARNAVATAAH